VQSGENPVRFELISATAGWETVKIFERVHKFCYFGDMIAVAGELRSVQSKLREFGHCLIDPTFPGRQDWRQALTSSNDTYIISIVELHVSRPLCLDLVALWPHWSASDKMQHNFQMQPKCICAVSLAGTSIEDGQIQNFNDIILLTIIIA